MCKYSDIDRYSDEDRIDAAHAVGFRAGALLRQDSIEALEEQLANCKQLLREEMDSCKHYKQLYEEAHARSQKPFSEMGNPCSGVDFREALLAALQLRLTSIAGNEEKLLEAWVAQHGFKPDECEIIRQDMQDGTVRMWVEKRGEFQELQSFRKRESLVQALVEYSVEGYSFDTINNAAEAVRDFKL